MVPAVSGELSLALGNFRGEVACLQGEKLLACYLRAAKGSQQAKSVIAG